METNVKLNVLEENRNTPAHALKSKVVLRIDFNDVTIMLPYDDVIITLSAI